MKVKFTEDVELRNAANEVIFAAKAGETHDLKDDAAQRWIRRGKAEAVDKESPAQQFMAEGAKAPDLSKTNKGRSADDVAAQKKVDERVEKADRKPGADPDSTARAKPDALSSADVKGEAGAQTAAAGPQPAK